ncbi:MAG TPA: hypothetical protein VG387_02465 [Rhizomicrobium sp.]|jgi:hypothetical protein|nr:hypothetical protein [Rhizomicrobium sp.]
MMIADRDVPSTETQPHAPKIRQEWWTPRLQRLAAVDAEFGGGIGGDGCFGVS